jgi:hypothetical protein
MVFKKLAVKGVEEVTLDHLVVLRGIATALKEGDTTVDEVFAEEKPSPATKTDAIKEKLKGKAGEVAQVNQAATDTSPPKASEIKPTEPKPPALPAFDINKYNLSSLIDAQAAAAEFIAVLTANPIADRPGVFLASSGVTLVEAMRTHGLALDIKKIEALGISLPPTDDKPSSGSKKLFEKLGKPEGAAA